MISRPLMTPEHPRWREFCAALAANIKVYGGCAMTSQRTHARNAMRFIVSKFGGAIDVSRSMKYFADHGGYCDCEILLNVAASGIEDGVEVIRKAIRGEYN